VSPWLILQDAMILSMVYVYGAHNSENFTLIRNACVDIPEFDISSLKFTYM
jgi:hypothetical protein